MNFRHLEIFLAVCETSSMTQAAHQLYLAQPTVSQAIAELESYYGVRLFERLNHRLFLTDAGERLRSYARHMLNLSEQAKTEMADLSQGGVLRIGASLTVGAFLLPELVSRFQKEYPEIDVFTQVDNTGLIEHQILEDRLDLGLVEGATTSAYIVEQPYSDDQLVLIASPQHPLAKQDEVTLQELNGQVFIAREAGSGTQAIFEHAMEAAQVSWKAAGIYNNNEAIRQAVGANLGLAVVSEISVKEELRQGKLVLLDVPGILPKRRFNLIHHRQKFFSRAMRLFWDFIISPS
jgi:LysR family transcriptional regulator, transcriptional activator of the cysJI operon